MFNAIKRFICAGKQYEVGDVVPDSIAVVLGNRVTGYIDPIEQKEPEKEQETPKIVRRTKMVETSKNKAILSTKKSKVSKK